MILRCIFTTTSEWMKSEDSAYLNFFIRKWPPFKEIFLKNMQRTTDLYDSEYILYIGIRCFFRIYNFKPHESRKRVLFQGSSFLWFKILNSTFLGEQRVEQVADMTWHGSSAVVCMENRWLLLSSFVFFIPLLFFLLLCFLKPLGAQNATKRVWENIPLKGIVSAASLKWFVWKKNWPLFLS